MAWVTEGEFTMGSDDYYPEERPTHAVHVDGFWMDRYPVTNAAFAAFVEATGYVTVSERSLRPEDYPGVSPELLVPGSSVFAQPSGQDAVDEGSWWQYLTGANWRCPQGPDSSIEDRYDHPVVHIAFADAIAFARWAGKMLPTEAQWERAARGGLAGRAFVWGDELAPGGRVMANIWHGEFPWRNSKVASPGPESVGSYPANGFGLFDMAGNVWEWTTDYYRPRHTSVGRAGNSGSCCAPRNPTGPRMALAEPETPTIPLRVLKGGSYLCAPNYCARYRPAARIPQAADSSACHIGFRCVASSDSTVPSDCLKGDCRDE
ncbi:MAG: formylglycine-generating enzyme family protein [Solirubrobacteraceae bacterium]